MEIPAPGAGVIAEIRVKEGTTVEVGTVLAVVESSASAAASPPAAKPAAQRRHPPRSPPRREPASWSRSRRAERRSNTRPGASAKLGRRTAARRRARDDHQRLSPAVRRLAAEHRLDLAAVSGSGRNGRITRRNVLEFIHSQTTTAATPPAAAPLACRGRPVAAAAPAARAPASVRRLRLRPAPDTAVHAHPQAHGRAHGALEGYEPARAASRRGRLSSRRRRAQDRRDAWKANATATP